MKLFGKKEKKSCCYCAKENLCHAEKTTTGQESGNIIKVLGSGCAKCQDLEKYTLQAVKELGMDFQIEHVTDFSEIAAYGVMSTPALVINEKVEAYGKVLSVEEVKQILKNIR